MKKIAFFMIPSLIHAGGAEQYFIEIANKLADKNNLIDLITLDEKSYHKFGLALHFLNGHFFSQPDLTPRESANIIKKRLVQARWINIPWNQMKEKLISYDLIYSKNELVELITLFLFGFNKLPPVIVSCLTPILFNKTSSLRSFLHNLIYLGPIYRFLLSKTSLVIVSNSKEYQLMKKWHINTVKIPYPMPETQTQFLDYKTELKGGVFQAALIGRLTEQKGIDQLPDLCQKLNKFNKKNIKIQLNIFGFGDKKNTDIVNSLCHKYSWIKFHGYVKHQTLLKQLSNHNLIISPSHYETFGYSILEAQTLGIPVIAYDIPGPQDIIINKQTGFLVKNNEQFVQAIINLATKKIVLNSQLIVKLTRERFGQEAIIASLKNTFNQIWQ